MRKEIVLRHLASLLLLIGLIVLAVGSTDSNSSSSSKPSSPTGARPAQAASKKTAAPVPSYVIVHQEKYDAPVKTEVALYAVLSGTITEPGLKALRQKLVTLQPSEVGLG